MYWNIYLCLIDFEMNLISMFNSHSSFMKKIGIVILTLAMQHWNEVAITKVRCNRNFRYQSPLFKGHACRSCGKGFSFWLAFSQILLIWFWKVSLEFESISRVIPLHFKAINIKSWLFWLLFLKHWKRIDLSYLFFEFLEHCKMG